eukprot:5860722-Amphidinium_carterae.1
MMVSLSHGGRNVRKQSLLGRRHHTKPEKTKDRQQRELRNENLSLELSASSFDQKSPRARAACSRGSGHVGQPQT